MADAPCLILSLFFGERVGMMAKGWDHKIRHYAGETAALTGAGGAGGYKRLPSG